MQAHMGPFPCLIKKVPLQYILGFKSSLSNRATCTMLSLWGEIPLDRQCSGSYKCKVKLIHVAGPYYKLNFTTLLL